MAIEVEFTIEPRVEKDKRMWTAYCDVLGMAASGTTEAGAEDNLVKTVQTLARVLRRRGILEDTLVQAGLKYKVVETKGLRVIA